MGLFTSINNAVTGLRVNQDALSVVSRNIANSGTPGYHRQTLNVVDYTDGNSSYARTMGVQRAFDQNLQTYYNRQVSNTAMVDVEASFLEQLQTYLGKPGSAGSLDTLYQGIANSLQGLSTSPDDYTARAEVVANAQAMAETLNRLSANIQSMRQETEQRMAGAAQSLNSMLSSLSEVNQRLVDIGMDDTSRASLLDQRDRMVAGIGEVIDIKVDYRANGSVAVMTRSGIGLLDQRPATLAFESAGNLQASSQFNHDSDLTKVGKLLLTTPSGVKVDLVAQGVIQGGELGGLLNLRDRTLVEAQAQLDDIAAALATAFSTVPTAGTAVTDGANEGFDVDLDGLAPGNDVLITYTEDGVEKQVRLVNTTAEMDYIEGNGTRVVGVDFASGGPAAAAALGTSIPGLQFAGPDATTLRVLNSAPAHAVEAAVARKTAGADQDAGLGLNLFVDLGDRAFTNAVDDVPPQRQGFAGRIAINSDILADNSLLVQHTTGGTLGDSARPDFLINQLKSMRFESGGDPAGNSGQFRLSGTVSDFVSQTINYQGSSIGRTIARRDDQMLTLETITQQMEADYGVNIDEEMSRLIALQNAYAANARVVSIVQDLLETLMAI